VGGLGHGWSSDCWPELKPVKVGTQTVVAGKIPVGVDGIKRPPPGKETCCTAVGPGNHFLIIAVTEEGVVDLSTE